MAFLARRAPRRTARRTASRDDAAAAPDAAAPNEEAPEEAVPAAPEEPAYMAEIEQLNELKTKGIINDEDYEAKKKQILGV